MSWFEELPAKERQKLSDKIAFTFKSLDKDKGGTIDPEELKSLLKKIRGFDRWEEEDFEVFFNNADWNSDAELSFEEFVDWILQIEIPQLYDSRSLKKYSVYRTREIAYASGVTVPLEAVMEDLKGYGEQLIREEVPPVATKLREFVSSKLYNKTLHRFFVDADANGNGVLGWNNREIYNFGIFCLDRFGLPRMGGDHVFHNLYKRFDLDKSESLSERECLCMMDSVLRALAKMQRQTDPSESSDEEDLH